MTSNEELSAKSWEEYEEDIDTFTCQPTLHISKKEIIKPIIDFERVYLLMEGFLNMPTEYKSSDLERIVDDIDTFELAEETIEIKKYSLSEAKKAISELLQSEDRDFSLLEISDLLMMDLSLAHKALLELEEEGKIE
ncbi:MAG: hypothetical protein ACTSW1_01290 [Candidatus Hodarchaeales archaeon]